MALHTSPRTEVRPRPVGGSQRSGPRRLQLRDRLDPYPRSAVARWLMRLAVALIYSAVTLLSAQNAAVVSTPNQQLLEHVARIQWDRADIAWVGEIYPPISTLIAAIIPGGRIGLGIAGAIVAGIFLQKMLEIMVQRRFSPWLAGLLILALSANPLFGYTVTENFPAFLGLAFFGLGITDIVRFVAWGNTQSGFRAGIYLMLAVLSDLSGLLYVLTAAASAPFLTLGRKHQHGARAANMVVILYPTVAALAAILSLNLIFTGRLVGTVGQRLVVGAAERFDSLGPLFMSVNGLLLVAPVLSAWLVALIVRRPGSILVSTLVFAAILGAFVVGLIPPGSAGNTFILMTMMAIALVPTPRSKLLISLMDVVAFLQIGIAWLTAFNRQIVIDWMNAVGGHDFTQLFH
ncbi:hypothetical protein BH09ACT4_BH09ACT4_05200 [soil metagenome]